MTSTKRFIDLSIAEFFRNDFNVLALLTQKLIYGHSTRDKVLDGSIASQSVFKCSLISEQQFVIPPRHN